MAADTGVAWLDAHGDFNTPASTVSGYLGGMPLACVAGHGLAELRQACGLHGLIQEQHIWLLAQSQVHMYPPPALRDPAVLETIVDGLARCAQIYIHRDIDVLDPTLVPGIDYPAAGGMQADELISVLEQLAASGRVAAMALTSVNPEHDPHKRTLAIAERVLGASIQALAGPAACA